ncbi:PREDICTED: putative two-component response regulator-like APRR8 isoform X1 [Camelina sativa]|uniref:Two-component response regulator-like APRR8 isoform X1 n=2 Tax=Camelina sativa TaxID=90675 RepID=A0ABM1QV24_CAMSA|nr:PREDICTED: putative two-component response regulator-like APRR8 isoform X1 [Camelina sativa]XP_019090612.1 PREDICTED: putative two-component response regulator-like APRR8 isoform X1 [Camelina sativa]
MRVSVSSYLLLRGFSTKKGTKATERFSDKICFLLLESDATWLANLSEMIRKSGCEELRLIEINKYELLEKLRLICEIPVVVLGACVKDDSIEECRRRGAELRLAKPLMEHYLEILCQFTVRRLDDELKKSNKNNEARTDEHSQGKYRKKRADRDTGEQTEKDCCVDLGQQKKPKLICADDLQKKTLQAVPNIEEANTKRKKPTEIKKIGEDSEKKKPEPVCMEEELETLSTQPVTDSVAYGEYEFQERDFHPLESVEESQGPHEITLSPRESSNKNVAVQLQVQAHEALDEELMQDGISLSDLELDLEEGQGSDQEQTLSYEDPHCSAAVS